MKPSKVRLKRRAQRERLAAAGHELEQAAHNFSEGRHSAQRDQRIWRERLYQAAIVFAAEVDGEEQAETAKVTPIAKAAK